MSAIHRFEIPAAYFERARTFNEMVMELRLFINDMREAMGSMLGVFPHEGEVGG